MTIPFWCLLVGALLPYVWTTFSFVARKRQFGAADNKLPREQQKQLTGWGARAVGAHYNAFEALVVFAPAVLVAHVAGADPVLSTRLALGWVAARALHGVFYLLDIDKLRSLAFTAASAASLCLFLAAAKIL